VLKELHVAFVLLGGRTGLESSEVLTLARLRVLFTRIEPIAAGLKFAYHTISYAEAFGFRTVSASSRRTLTPTQLGAQPNRSKGRTLLMKLAAALCGFIGIVQLVFTHALFGVVWIIASGVLFAIDHYYGE